MSLLVLLAFLLLAGVGLLALLPGPAAPPPASTVPGVEQGDPPAGRASKPPALVGRGEPPAAAEASVGAVPITVPSLDPARTRSRTLRLRVEGDVTADEVIDVAVLDVHADRVATARLRGPQEVVLPPLAWGEYAVVVSAGNLRGEARAIWNGVTVVTLARGRRVRGMVRGMEGKPLEGVTLRVHPEYLRTGSVEPEEPTTPPLAVTDEQGRFDVLVSRRTSGRPTWLAFRHARHGGMFHAVQDGSGPAEVVVQLGHRAVEVVPIHVVDESGGDVVPRLRWSRQSELGIAPTVPSARFELAWPGGRHPLKLLVDAVGHERVTVERPVDTTRELRVVLPRAPWAHVRVRDTNGAGVPGAEVTLLAFEHEEVAWRDAVRTDVGGDAYVRAPTFPHTLLVQSPGLAPVFTSLDAGQESADVRLEEDRPTILVLPKGLQGFVEVALESSEGVLLWERRFDLTAGETALPGLPRGPKVATVWLWGKRFRHELAFDTEARVEVPAPTDWPGVATVAVDIEGGASWTACVPRSMNGRPRRAVSPSPRSRARSLGSLSCGVGRTRF